jgi:NAD(P)H-flavin reductase
MFLYDDDPLTGAGKDFATKYKKFHGRWLFYTWLFADIPILIGFFGKSFGLSYRVHSLLMTVVSTAVIVIMSLIYYVAHFKAKHSPTPGYAYGNDYADDKGPFFAYISNHGKMAKLIFWCTVIQAFGGSLLERLYLLKNSKISKYKKFSRWMHGAFGMFLWAATRCQMYYKQGGWDWVMIKPWVQKIFLVSYIGLPIIVVVFKIVSILPNWKNPFKRAKGATKNPNQNKIVALLKSGATRAEMIRDYPNKTVMIFEDKVYDMSGYIHPGGDIFFQNQNWNEVSRYMNGAHPDERTGTKINHSISAFLAMDMRLIGNIASNPQQNSERDLCVIYNNKLQSLGWTQNQRWKVVSKVLLSPKLVLMRFQNPLFKVKTELKGIRWIGRHFYIKGGSRKKPYTTVISLCDEYNSYRVSLLQKIDQLHSGMAAQNEAKATTQNFEIPEFSNTLCFAIKPYGKYSLSSAITSAKKNSSSFSISGPYGAGIDLSESFSGRCVIMTIGTGYLPFIDLFDFLLKKAAHNLFKSANRQDLLQTIQPAQDYEKILKGASFEFFGSFASKADFVGVEWIEKLYQMSEDGDMGLFRAQIKIEKNQGGVNLPMTNSFFNYNFVKEKLFRDGTKPDKLILCGTSEFMKSVAGYCEDLGFPRGRIQFI